MEAAQRQARSEQAEAMLFALSEHGVSAVATSFVDNSGVSRVKTVPLSRLPQLAGWGVGFSSSFDYFRFDDHVAAPETGEGPVGDLRIIPDLSRLVTLAAQPGWAWAPGDRYDQDGAPHPACSRLLLRRIVDRAEQDGWLVRTAFELEWVIESGEGGTADATDGPAYGLNRLVSTAGYARELLGALAAQGVTVLQFHPEYAPGQFEVSVAAESPVAAADTSVLVRTTVRAVGARHGFRTSFSPKVESDGVGNGGHVHLSLWRGDRNQLTGGDGPDGLTGPGEAFCAGILDHLPALLAVGAPSVASYLRLVPSHWAGAYACWGRENREAALRLIARPDGGEEDAANLEVKCVDLTANPYLLLAGLITAGLDGVGADRRLPDPVLVDPAALSDDERRTRGIRRLPTGLGEATDAFAADPVLTAAFGTLLTDTLLAVRRSEIERFADATPEEIARTTRWVH